MNKKAGTMDVGIFVRPRSSIWRCIRLSFDSGKDGHGIAMLYDDGCMS